MRRWILVVLVASAGCGADAKRAPTCAQAMAHFYAAGCRYADGSQQPPVPYSEADAVSLCQELVAAAPAQCQDEIDDWNECNASVPSPASSTTDCDCLQDLQAISRCR
jgi:hypothetical protein